MAVLLHDRSETAGQKQREALRLPRTSAVVALFAFSSRMDRDSMRLFARTHGDEVRAAAIASTGQEVLELLHGGDGCRAVRPVDRRGRQVAVARRQHREHRLNREQMQIFLPGVDALLRLPADAQRLDRQDEAAELQICVHDPVPRCLIGLACRRQVMAGLKRRHGGLGIRAVDAVRHDLRDGFICRRDHAEHGLQAADRLPQKGCCGFHRTTSCLTGS